MTLGGCVTIPNNGSSAANVRISIVAKDDPPELPVRPDVEIQSPESTEDAPPQIQATVTNISDERVNVGEEREIVFAFVHSEHQPGIQLLPEPSSNYSSVEPGCWRLTDGVPIPEYYGIVTLDPGESVSRVNGVWGSHELDQGCLPTGQFRFEGTYTMAPDGPPEKETSARWGFELSITERGD